LHAIAGLFRLTRRICLPFLPQLHTPQEDLEFFREKIFPRHDLTIALMGGTIAGYSAVSPGWLEQLYVLPQCQGSGVGALLLARAKEGQAAFQLYVFQKNLRARRFYEKHGLQLVRKMKSGSRMRCMSGRPARRTAVEFLPVCAKLVMWPRGAAANDELAI
jgi:putative acetyltransferase